MPLLKLIQIGENEYRPSGKFSFKDDSIDCDESFKNKDITESHWEKWNKITYNQLQKLGLQPVHIWENNNWNNLTQLCFDWYNYSKNPYVDVLAKIIMDTEIYKNIFQEVFIIRGYINYFQKKYDLVKHEKIYIQVYNYLGNSLYITIPLKNFLKLDKKQIL